LPQAKNKYYLGEIQIMGMNRENNVLPTANNNNKIHHAGDGVDGKNKEQMMKGMKEMVLSAVALMVFFIAYGIIQERIMTQPYGDAGEMFQFSAYLVLSNRIVAIITAASLMRYKGEKIQSTAPIYNYFLVSFTNTLSTYCQYEALKYVSFPTQTLGKCVKTLPVLILGSLLFRTKKYTMSDVVVCVMVTFGCAIFFITGVRQFNQPTYSTPRPPLLSEL
jgi:drug/metabolite transporter (DMT)-like permease